MLWLDADIRSVPQAMLPTMLSSGAAPHFSSCISAQLPGISCLNGRKAHAVAGRRHRQRHKPCCPQCCAQVQPFAWAAATMQRLASRSLLEWLLLGASGWTQTYAARQRACCPPCCPQVRDAYSVHCCSFPEFCGRFPVAAYSRTVSTSSEQHNVLAARLRLPSSAGLDIIAPSCKWRKWNGKLSNFDYNIWQGPLQEPAATERWACSSSACCVL